MRTADPREGQAKPQPVTTSSVLGFLQLENLCRKQRSGARQWSPRGRVERRAPCPISSPPTAGSGVGPRRSSQPRIHDLQRQMSRGSHRQNGHPFGPENQWYPMTASSALQRPAWLLVHRQGKNEAEPTTLTVSDTCFRLVHRRSSLRRGGCGLVRTTCVAGLSEAAATQRRLGLGILALGEASAPVPGALAPWPHAGAVSGCGHGLQPVRSAPSMALQKGGMPNWCEPAHE